MYYLHYHLNHPVILDLD
jgi:energy-converting hydrogenase A subunit M